MQAAEEILNEEIRFKMSLEPDEREAILKAFKRFGQQIIENVNNITDINELLKLKKN